MSSETVGDVFANKLVSREECVAIRLLHHRFGMAGREIARWLERSDKTVHRHMNGRCSHGKVFVK